MKPLPSELLPSGLLLGGLGLGPSTDEKLGGCMAALSFYCATAPLPACPAGSKGWQLGLKQNAPTLGLPTSTFLDRLELACIAILANRARFKNAAIHGDVYPWWFGMQGTHSAANIEFRIGGLKSSGSHRAG